MRELLHTLAWNERKHVVHARDAAKGGLYSCPVCDGRLIHRRGTRRPHLAHQAGATPCAPESILHKVFKQLIHDRLVAALRTGQEVPVRWSCPHCTEEHSGNLLKKARKVVLEYEMGVARSDIALLDGNEHVVAAIEVVVTHAPEPRVHQYYRENHIALIQFNICSEDDLERSAEPALHPDVMDQCVTPRCPECHAFQERTELRLLQVACKECGTVSKMALLNAGRDRLADPATPEVFTDAELALAMDHGASIKEQWNTTLHRLAWGNVCSGCVRPFNGAFHPGTYEPVPWEVVGSACTVSAGFYCRMCTDAKGVIGLRAFIHRLKKSRKAVNRSSNAKRCFCCSNHLPHESEYVLCGRCYLKWKHAGYPEPAETHCVDCGVLTPLTKEVPFCPACRKAWGKSKGQLADLDTELERASALLRNIKTGKFSI